MRTARFLTLVFSLSINSSVTASKYTCDPTVPCGCSTLSTVVTSRIVGGEAASNYSWGWMISLQLRGRHRCGASLLSSEYAITAAHCLVDPSIDLSLLSIFVGTNYLNDDSSSTIQRRAVTRVTIHPNYETKFDVNDIAIIQFSPLTVSSSSKLTCICLPTANHDPFTINSSLVAIGWGYTNEHNRTLSNYLQQVTVQAFSVTSIECLESLIIDFSSQFCAGSSTGGKDACQGDSGGPLMAFVDDRWVLAGITSIGNGCARPGEPGIYTRVSSFISFINSNTNSSVSETTTVTAMTYTSQPNNSQSSKEGDGVNIIGNSILVMMISLCLILSCVY